MKIIDTRMYIEFKDAIDAGISENTLKKASERKSPSWVMIPDPTDKRKVLIDFEELKDQYKQSIISHFGNPYDLLSKQPIRNMVTKDIQADQFYTSYRYYDNKALPALVISTYTTAASWLNMLVKAEENKREVKKLLNLTVTEFFTKVCEIIETDNIKLPSNIIKLRQKIDLYRKDGYKSIIHKAYGNENAKKVNSEVAEALLLSMIENHNQPDDVYICFQYNTWATENNHKQISPATVGNYRRKNLPTIIIGREGNNAFNEKFIREQKGFRPSRPGYLWESDDNNLDFLFSDGRYDYHRYVSIVVIDSHCDLVLGKSYIMGHQPKVWMVKAAYMDAMYYIKGLTGGWYLPFEVKADAWMREQLYPFYHRLANFVPPAVGNKHRGFIEPFFGSDHWKRMQKAGTINYNGNNMTAKFRGVNTEALEKINKKRRPLIGQEAEELIENFFHRLRTFPAITRENMNAPSKEEQWLTAWNKLTDDQKRPITDEQFLLTFGIEHNPERQITITNRGIEPQISGVQYSYDIPASINALSIIGSKVNVVYDPYDMSRVLITNHADIRFIAKEAQLQPRALEDTYTGSRTMLNALLSEKVDQVGYAADAKDKRGKVLKSANIDAEAILQAGVINKQLKNSAEQHLIERKGEKDQDYENFIDESTDFSEYYK